MVFYKCVFIFKLDWSLNARHDPFLIVIVLRNVLEHSDVALDVVNVIIFRVYFIHCYLGVKCINVEMY